MVRLSYSPVRLWALSTVGSHLTRSAGLKGVYVSLRRVWRYNR